MTSPWPAPNHTLGYVMCCLCFGSKTFEELSRTPENKLTDVCMDCRFIEIQMVLRAKHQIE